MEPLYIRQNKSNKFDQQEHTMQAIAVKNEKSSSIAEVKKMRDYSKESVFKKKIDKAKAFLDKNGLPDSFTEAK